MLRRKAEKTIENWIKEGREALLVTGARQIGKTFIIRELLSKSGFDYMEFNLLRDSDIKEALGYASEGHVDSFINAVRVGADHILKEDAIIFIDEVQECKEIVTAIKFLVEKNGFRYILSGSLLGVELVDLKSAPVGYLRSVDMFPLDLEEYYEAIGLDRNVIGSLKKSYEKREPVDPFIHQKLLDAFYNYLIVGGMPEAVQEFVDSGDLAKVKDIHEKIKKEYERDFTKYEEEKKLVLRDKYELIPAELLKGNGRFQFSDLGKNIKFRDVTDDFVWLKNAGVALPTYNATEPVFPLLANKKHNLFKLFLSDVGMLTSAYGRNTILSLIRHGDNLNCGAIFENFVAQELKAHGFDLYYFSNKKHGEIDFLIESEDDSLAIEVKSGADFKKHPCTSYYLSQGVLKKALVLSTMNVETTPEIDYLPIYMTMFIEEGGELPKIKVPDLSDLSV